MNVVEEPPGTTSVFFVSFGALTRRRHVEEYRSGPQVPDVSLGANEECPPLI